MSDKQKRSFKQNIEERLQGLGITVPELAGKMIVPYNTLRSWVNSGKVAPDQIENFAKALRMEVSTLKEWGLKPCQLKKQYQQKVGGVTLDLRLTADELKLLAETQKILGDLSIKMIISIIGELRKNRPTITPVSA